MFLLSVAMIWAVACITPGPNTLLVMRYALTAPRRVPILAAMGTITGTFCWGLAGWLGINVLFQAAPFAYVALKIVGGLYLVWLGLKIFLDARKSRQSADIAAARIDVPLKTAYRMGLVTNLANPKSALFVASLFAATMPVGTPFLYGLAAIAVMVTVSTIYYSFLVALITHRTVAAAYLKAKKKIDLGVGMVFVGFGTKLLMSQR
ncbi:Amino acid exporter [Neorhizobium galegae bv. officinalis bv. officinalis str. HAMBI 1141]|uniref:LysE family translocator n=2 Tax=Neorhizobium galegae TaxID=399 RepID=A0A6A1TM19_NEOGA|nr:LysE family transporter [Neorhizobium galegae]KAB1084985.1 LysE family translocator [Neorhizobium galegae]MCQ1852666.1 LysE family translocator [Neorhizobium galegae]CDN52370.1 Amino acid exporter [Neorhizobium galegae bv. officinalis bv. officinalis str. HAMBI 1141]